MHNDQKTWIEISRSALTQNVKAFRCHLGSSVAVMAVVKSNAYGHGLVETATIADRAGAAWFGVDNVDEGIILRKNGIQKPIFILGYTMKTRVADAVRHDLSFVIYNLETARSLERLRLTGRRGSVARVHIKIETGTTRQGIKGDDLSRLARRLKKIPGVVIEGASTHYANIEDTTDASYAKSQLRRFEEEITLLHREGIDPPFLHTACSAAAILFPKTHFNLARIGISMYGLWPSKETQKEGGIVLTPALAWKTIIAQIKTVPKGASVSYGLTERTTRASTLAILPIGYWDGYDRGLSSIGHVLIRGHICKIIGRVCMNMCVVDVTDLPHVHVEDEVVLLDLDRARKIARGEPGVRFQSLEGAERAFVGE
ncbi:MAG: alanine racemase, partial [Patescibacteria group bacterium]